MIVTFWNTLKAGWSRANDWIMRGAPRRPIPSFPTPEAAAAYLMKHARYTRDLAGGAGDNYTHPERFQWAMETGKFDGLPIDCDDYAIWAYRALLTIPGCQPDIVTLRDAGVVGSHVVCTYRMGLHRGVIDTNGHRQIGSVDEANLCRVFTDIYAALGYRYVEAVPTPYPF